MVSGHERGTGGLDNPRPEQDTPEQIEPVDKPTHRDTHPSTWLNIDNESDEQLLAFLGLDRTDQVAEPPDDEGGPSAGVLDAYDPEQRIAVDSHAPGPDEGSHPAAESTDQSGGRPDRRDPYGEAPPSGGDGRGSTWLNLDRLSDDALRRAQGDDRTDQPPQPATSRAKQVGQHAVRKDDTWDDRPADSTDAAAAQVQVAEQRPEPADRAKPVPVEGRDPDHRPIAPNEPRPRVEWRPGAPAVQADLRYRNLDVHVPSELVRPARDANGLGETRAWPDDNDSDWARRAKTDEGKARAAEAVGADNWSNAKHAGEVFLDKLSGDLKDRYPAGVPFSHEGFPIFEHYASVTVSFEDGFAPSRPDGRPDRAADERRANAIFGWKDTPMDMTWHHKEDGCTMVLVDRELHNWVRHWGGERVTRIRNEGEA